MRDFRDAKAMAHALRHALQVQAVTTTHSECLELIAQAFGYDNWNILSARIEAAKLPASGAAALAPVAEQEPAPQKTLYCSFCGKSQHDVTALIAGPTVFICNECVGICDDILIDQEMLKLLKADEESGNKDYPATVAHLRTKSSEEIASCVERSRKGVERSRVELRSIQSMIATQDGGDPMAQDVTPPLWLKDKTKEELVVSASKLERLLKRYEVALRLAAGVLDTAGPSG